MRHDGDGYTIYAPEAKEDLQAEIRKMFPRHASCIDDTRFDNAVEAGVFVFTVRRQMIVVARSLPEGIRFGWVMSFHNGNEDGFRSKSSTSGWNTNLDKADMAKVLEEFDLYCLERQLEKL